MSKNFLSDMIELGIEGVFAYSEAKKKAGMAADVLGRLISGEEEVPVEEFLEMYDLRMYDFESKQDDIKFMKKWDFPGAYILHNCSRNTYHIGVSGSVLRKADREFRGYECQAVYEDWKEKDVFTIRIVRLEESGYNNIDLLFNDLVQKYGTYERAERSAESAPQKGFFSSVWQRLCGNKHQK